MREPWLLSGGSRCWMDGKKDAGMAFCKEPGSLPAHWSWVTWGHLEVVSQARQWGWHSFWAFLGTGIGQQEYSRYSGDYWWTGWGQSGLFWREDLDAHGWVWKSTPPHRKSQAGESGAFWITPASRVKTECRMQGKRRWAHLIPWDFLLVGTRSVCVLFISDDGVSLRLLLSLVLFLFFHWLITLTLTIHMSSSFIRKTTVFRIWFNVAQQRRSVKSKWHSFFFGCDSALDLSLLTRDWNQVTCSGSMEF